jgi:hypothetical protein
MRADGSAGFDSAGQLIDRIGYIEPHIANDSCE